MLRYFVIVLSCFILSYVDPLFAASSAKLEEKYKNWSVYTSMQDGQKLCYMVSSPVAQEGTYKKRGAPRLMVTHISKSIDEVSITSGFKYKSNSVKMIIDSHKSHLLPVIEGEVAWAQDIETDQILIDGMKKGARVVVKSQALTGATAKDTYSLMGFSKAYEKICALCGAR